MLANKSAFNNEIKQNQHALDMTTQQLAEELHKAIIRKISF